MQYTLDFIMFRLGRAKKITLKPKPHIPFRVVCIHQKKGFKRCVWDS